MDRGIYPALSTGQVRPLSFPWRDAGRCLAGGSSLVSSIGILRLAFCELAQQYMRIGYGGHDSRPRPRLRSVAGLQCGEARCALASSVLARRVLSVALWLSAVRGHFVLGLCGGATASTSPTQCRWFAMRRGSLRRGCPLRGAARRVLSVALWLLRCAVKNVANTILKTLDLYLAPDEGCLDLRPRDLCPCGRLAEAQARQSQLHPRHRGA